jgi:hypothetical protein
MSTITEARPANLEPTTVISPSVHTLAWAEMPGKQILDTYLIDNARTVSQAIGILNTLDRERDQGIKPGEPGSVSSYLQLHSYLLKLRPIEPEKAIEVEPKDMQLWLSDTAVDATAASTGEYIVSSPNIFTKNSNNSDEPQKKIAKTIWQPISGPNTREKAIQNELDLAPSVREAAFLIWAHFKDLAKETPDMDPPEDQGVDFIKWLGTIEAKEWIPDFRALYVDRLIQDEDARKAIVDGSTSKLHNSGIYNQKTLELSAALVGLYRYRPYREYTGNETDTLDISVDRRTEAFNSIADFAYDIREAWENKDLLINFSAPEVIDSLPSIPREQVTEDIQAKQSSRHKKIGSLSLRSLKLQMPKMKISGDRRHNSEAKHRRKPIR